MSPEKNTHEKVKKKKNLKSITEYTKDFNQCWKRNLKYHVISTFLLLLLSFHCVSSFFFLWEQQTTSNEEAKKFPAQDDLDSQNVISNNKTIPFNYYLLAYEWRFVMKRSLHVFPVLRSHWCCSNQKKKRFKLWIEFNYHANNFLCEKNIFYVLRNGDRWLASRSKPSGQKFFFLCLICDLKVFCNRIRKI